MYRSTCGNELSGTENVCPMCGVPVTGAPVAARPEHSSYEYARTTVASDLVTVTCDCYENLGWELTGSKTSQAGGTTALAFRRSRKIKNKAQLVKIQRTMDDLIASISTLEGEKTRKAGMRALTLGILSALVLRVRSLLRRAGVRDERRLGVGRVVLDADALAVVRGTEEVRLPPKEFRLLQFLLQNPGRTYTRMQLLDEVWGWDTESAERTVDVHVNRLRSRFADWDDFAIETIRGLGYRAVVAGA